MKKSHAKSQLTNITFESVKRAHLAADGRRPRQAAGLAPEGPAALFPHGGAAGLAALRRADKGFKAVGAQAGGDGDLPLAGL